MKELSKKDKVSVIIVDMYSGRENPRVPLQEVLNHSEIGPALKKMIPALVKRERVQNPPLKKLGEVALTIVDHDGLLLPKGESLQLHDLQLSESEREDYKILAEKMVLFTK